MAITVRPSVDNSMLVAHVLELYVCLGARSRLHQILGLNSIRGLVFLVLCCVIVDVVVVAVESCVVGGGCLSFRRATTTSPKSAVFSFPTGLGNLPCIATA